MQLVSLSLWESVMNSCLNKKQQYKKRQTTLILCSPRTIVSHKFASLNFKTLLGQRQLETYQDDVLELKGQLSHMSSTQKQGKNFRETFGINMPSNHLKHMIWGRLKRLDRDKNKLLQDLAPAEGPRAWIPISWKKALHSSPTLSPRTWLLTVAYAWAKPKLHKPKDLRELLKLLLHHKIKTSKWVFTIFSIFL